MGRSLQEDVSERLRQLVEEKPLETMEVLETIAEAINGRGVPPELARQAVHQAHAQYETQLSLMLVAAAKARVDRVVRALQALVKIEDQIYDPDFLAMLSPKDLVVVWKLIQQSLAGDLDRFERVVELRARITFMLQTSGGDVQAQATTHAADELFGDLSPQSRERLRRVMGRLIGTE